MSVTMDQLHRAAHALAKAIRVTEEAEDAFEQAEAKYNEAKASERVVESAYRDLCVAIRNEALDAEGA